MTEILESLPDTPMVIPGGLATDDRGEVSFVNDFSFNHVKRFYMVSNHQVGFIRAWHAHRNEGKFITVVSGSALIGAVRIDNWDSPSKESKPYRYILSEKKPHILWIPPGYANGCKSLTDDCRIVFYSTSSLNESMNDDIRYSARYWDIWEVEER